MFEIATKIIGIMVEKLTSQAMDHVLSSKPYLQSNLIKLHTEFTRLIEQSISVVEIIDSGEYKHEFFYASGLGDRNKLIMEELHALQFSYYRFSTLFRRVSKILDIYNEDLSKELCIEKDQKGDWLHRVDTLIESTPRIKMNDVGGPIEISESYGILDLKRITKFVEQEGADMRKKI